jgi:hypothetical protein
MSYRNAAQEDKKEVRKRTDDSSHFRRIIEVAIDQSKTILRSDFDKLNNASVETGSLQVPRKVWKDEVYIRYYGLVEKRNPNWTTFPNMAATNEIPAKVLKE